MFRQVMFVNKMVICLLTYFLISTFFSASAHAHAIPIATTPSIQESIESPVERIFLEFNESIDQSESTIKVLDEEKKEAQIGNSYIDPAENNTLVQDVQLIKKGVYTVEWSVVSKEDGHLTSGAYLFGYGQKPQTSNITSNQIYFSNSRLDIFVKIFSFLGEAIAVAVLLYSYFLRKKVSKKTKQRLSKIFLASILSLVIGSVAQMLNNVGAVLTFENIPTATSTVATLTSLIRFLVMIALFAWYIKYKKNFFDSKNQFLAAVPIFFVTTLIFLSVRVSHAAASELPYISVLINFIHLFFKELLTGTLIATPFILLSRNLEESTKVHSTMYVAKTSLVSIVIGALSGNYIVWLHLKSFSNLLSTEWGQILIGLTITAVLLLATRLLNTYLLLKQKINKTLLVSEMLISLLVIFLTGVIASSPPPVQTNFFKQIAKVQDQSIALEEVDYDQSILLLTISGERPESITVLAESSIAENPVTLSTKKISENIFEVQKEILTKEKWNILVTQENTNHEGYTVEFAYEVGKKTTDHQKTLVAFVSFGASLIIISISLLALWRLKTYKQTTASQTKLEQEKGPTRVIVTFILTAIILSTLYMLVIPTSFEKKCKQNGHSWLTALPQREGIINSYIPKLGCAVGVGGRSNFFTNERRYSLASQETESMLELYTQPTDINKGEKTLLEFLLLDEKREYQQNLQPIGNAIMHIFAVNKDGTDFAHLYPEQFNSITNKIRKNATFWVENTFNTAGNYMIVGEYSIRGKKYHRTYSATVYGEETNTEQLKKEEKRSDETDEGYQATLYASDKISTNKDYTFTFEIKKDDHILTDLEPYIGLPGYLTFFETEKNIFYSPEVNIPQSFIQKLLEPNKSKFDNIFTPQSFESKLQSNVRFEKNGIYKVFLEFSHKNKTHHADFTVHVEND